MIESIFVEGLIYGIMVLGVFITFRILDFPDLTVDGSFPMGAAIMALFITSSVNPWIALIVSQVVLKKWFIQTNTFNLIANPV